METRKSSSAAGLRSVQDIIGIEAVLADKVWYERHRVLADMIEQGHEIDPQIWKKAEESAEKIEKTYGKQNLGPYTDFGWGELVGKLSALRWILGQEWDATDS